MRRIWIVLLSACVASPGLAGPISPAGGGGGGHAGGGGGGFSSGGGGVSHGGGIAPAGGGVHSSGGGMAPAGGGYHPSGPISPAAGWSHSTAPSAAPSGHWASPAPGVRPAGPGVSGAGQPIQRAAVPSSPPGAQTAIIRDPNFVNQVNQDFHHHHDEGVFFWGSWYGWPYSWYWWGGVPWVGFYSGPYFYWTRYYNGYWWWYDDPYGSWMYYDGSAWQPSSDAQGAPPEGSAPPATAAPQPQAAPQPPGKTVVSPDGARMVQIVGQDAQAFLYQRRADGSGSFLRYLAKDAESAKWSGKTIVLTLKGGGTRRFDRDGRPL